MTALPYTVRRSDRARRARIVVDPAGVEVVVPRRMALRHVAPFVEEKRPWIERTLRKLREAEAAGPAVRLEDGGEVPYLGEPLALRVREERGRVRPHVKLRGRLGAAPSAGGPSTLALPAGLPAAALHVALPPGGDLRAALEAWYRRRARAEVAARLDAACARAGSTYSRLTVRSQRSRWASCSSTGAMSFNWRLLLAPAEILDYVVEHEVAHLEVLDHSPRFWSLLASRCPDYREHERWLRLHGPALRL